MPPRTMGEMLVTLRDHTFQTIEPWPERPARLGVLVVEKLVDAIVSGDLSPGSALPAEPELCATFRVSRSVIREVGKVLEGKGLVRVRQGHGTTVCDQDEWNLLDPEVLAATVRHDDEFTVIGQLIYVRATLEARMAFEAATHATHAELDELAKLISTMAASLGDPGRYLATDGSFHDLIMRASRNRLARSVVRVIEKEAHKSPFYMGSPGVRHVRATHQGHVAIYERLRERDATGASTAMFEHINRGWQARKKTVTLPQKA